MNADTDGHAPRPEGSAHVASCVIRVSDLDRSLTFYRDVFSCRVALHEADMALLLAPNGFQVYLHSRQSFHRRGAGSLGCQYLMWATGSESDLRDVTQRLRAYDTAALPHRKRSDVPGRVRPRRRTRDCRPSQPPPASPHGDRGTTTRLTDMPQMAPHNDQPTLPRSGLRRRFHAVARRFDTQLGQTSTQTPRFLQLLIV